MSNNRYLFLRSDLLSAVRQWWQSRNQRPVTVTVPTAIGSVEAKMPLHPITGTWLPRISLFGALKSAARGRHEVICIAEETFWSHLPVVRKRFTRVPDTKTVAYTCTRCGGAARVHVSTGPVYGVSIFGDVVGMAHMHMPTCDVCDGVSTGPFAYNRDMSPHFAAFTMKDGPYRPLEGTDDGDFLAVAWGPKVHNADA